MSYWLINERDGIGVSLEMVTRFRQDGTGTLLHFVDGGEERVDIDFNYIAGLVARLDTDEDDEEIGETGH
jgi:hypothetical protein